MSQQKSTTTSGHVSKTILVDARYKLGKIIGKGNFGEVRAGKDIRTNEDVAIKTVFNNIYNNI